MFSEIRLKRHETPRKDKVRNSKSRLAAQKLRQLKKRNNTLRAKLKR